MVKIAKTVMWFNISATLGNEEIARLLDPALSVENGGGKDLKLFRRGEQAVACRAAENYLKIFLSEGRLLRVAKNRWKVAGLS